MYFFVITIVFIRRNRESIDSFAFPHRVGITTVVVALKLLRTMGEDGGCISREREREITFENVITKVFNDKDHWFGCKPSFDTIPSFSRSRFLRVFYDFRLQASPANRFAFQVTRSGCLLYECREHIIISDIVGDVVVTLNKLKYAR